MAGLSFYKLLVKIDLRRKQRLRSISVEVLPDFVEQQMLQFPTQRNLEGYCSAVLMLRAVFHAQAYLMLPLPQTRVSAVGRVECLHHVCRCRGEHARGKVGVGTPSRKPVEAVEVGVGITIVLRIFVAQGRPKRAKRH